MSSSRYRQPAAASLSGDDRALTAPAAAKALACARNWANSKQTATRDLKAHPATGRMVEKLATPAGRTAYAERKWLSEAPNGWIKHVLGFRRFSLRGLAKVRCEWDLVCLALNVKRLQPLMAA